jgi:hypothetical protein
LTDPAKYAAKVEKDAAKEAEKAAAKAAGAEAPEDEEEKQEAPTNLINTEARPAAPDWKDVPEGMVALYREASKRPDTLGTCCASLRKSWCGQAPW